jgi:uncharacterized membrane protein YedE/YeeE
VPLLLFLWLYGDNGIGVPPVGLRWMALAGLLMGVDTRLGGGCTSGHGCVAWLAPRPLLAAAFRLPGVRQGRLVVGAALFGIGGGLPVIIPARRWLCSVAVRRRR